MDNPVNIPLTVEEWAKIVIEKWVNMAKTLNISMNDPLTDDRFKYYLTTQADGNIEKIKFTYDFYLKFVNWGVGKGVSISNRDTIVAAGLTKRRRKPWFDNVFPKQLSILGHLLSERYAQRTTALIKTGIESYRSDGTNVTKHSNKTKSGKSSSDGFTAAQYDKVHGN